jgi:hypothetical protein
MTLVACRRHVAHIRTMTTNSVAPTLTPYDLRAAVEQAHLWLLATFLQRFDDDVTLDLRAVPDLARFVARVMPSVRLYERLVDRLGPL